MIKNNKYAMICEYEGTKYNGFQSQSTNNTIQDKIEHSIYKIINNSINIEYAGRTDSGVHAKHQVISVNLKWNHEPIKLQNAINNYLPSDIRVRNIKIAPKHFHPRKSAISRSYEYSILRSDNSDVFRRNTVLLDNALASMGAGLPSAMTSSMIYPERKVISVCGDGGFMMNSQELETAVRLKLNLVILIHNAGAYGMVKWKQENMSFENYGLSFNNPDFVEYAKAYGANGHRITSASSLYETLEDSLNTPGIHVIDCPVDYSENDHILNVELKELSSSL